MGTLRRMGRLTEYVGEVTDPDGTKRQHWRRNRESVRSRAKREEKKK